jgi:dolichol-phosphate mannosyltransferase
MMLRLKKLAWRFARFGVVGGSGIVVNQVVLFVGMQFFFTSIVDAHARLDYALPLAIAVATTYNFFWNRLWTWHERRAKETRGVAMQYVKYVLATLLGSVLQFYLTKYLLTTSFFLGNVQMANLLAIGLVSVLNFLINDRLTFRKVRE